MMEIAYDLDRFNYFFLVLHVAGGAHVNIFPEESSRILML